MLQLDAAGLLFLLLITATSLATSLAQSAEAVQCLWLACLLHALPLAAMLVNLPWYIPPATSHDFLSQALLLTVSQSCVKDGGLLHVMPHQRVKRYPAQNSCMFKISSRMRISRICSSHRSPHGCLCFRRLMLLKTGLLLHDIRKVKFD